jgi:hypothetical protein
MKLLTITGLDDTRVGASPDNGRKTDLSCGVYLLNANPTVETN